MNILFLSLEEINSFEQHGIYTDLLRQFIALKHKVYCISPVERRTRKNTQIITENGNTILQLKIGNIQKVNFIEKGISTILIERQFISAIKTYFSNVKFDLVLYPTPPITFVGAVEFVKKRDCAKAYLMLKDIFPQNAVDLGLMADEGMGAVIYRYFKYKEKRLYTISDKIGCMSDANCEYLLKHNPYLKKDRVEICPNCIEIANEAISKEEKVFLREKYNLPQNKRIYVYGGNLGRPQDVEYIVQCLKACQNREDIYFVIAGSGTDRYLLEEYIETDAPENVRLLGQVPKEEYDKMIACCDIGMIFLASCFTIPNFPSRLLSYMQAGLPVLTCTDDVTDIGRVVVDGQFGWWCKSDSVEVFLKKIEEIQGIDCLDYVEIERDYLKRHYNPCVIAKQIAQWCCGDL